MRRPISQQRQYWQYNRNRYTTRSDQNLTYTPFYEIATDTASTSTFEPVTPRRTHSRQRNQHHRRSASAYDDYQRWRTMHDAHAMTVRRYRSRSFDDYPTSSDETSAFQYNTEYRGSVRRTYGHLGLAPQPFVLDVSLE